MLVRWCVAALLPLGALAPSLQETVAPSKGEEFKLTFSAAAGIEFPFETNAESGGGGCAPPQKLSLALGEAGTRLIPLATQRIAVVTEENKVIVDTDCDGLPDETIKGTEGTVRLKMNHAGQKLDYAVRLYGDGSGTWTYDRWGYTSGKVQGTTLVLIDENANGLYGEFGKDRMVVGDGRQAHPLSPIVSLGGKLYELSVEPTGTVVRTRPYEGLVGTLDVNSKFDSKGKLVSAVVKSGNNCFDVAGKGAVTLPAGEYRLFSGVVSAAPQLAHLKQGKLASFAVEPGKTTTLEWGGTVAIHFKHEFKDSIVTIRPEQIQVRGQSGEEYFAFKPMSFTPTVVIRDMRSDAVVQKGTMVLG